MPYIVDGKSKLITFDLILSLSKLRNISTLSKLSTELIDINFADYKIRTAYI